ncbi:MAG: hypothetical protein KGJ55_07095 [Gammaproteobacteria bacterium]|nr:hypothetical protein [Gammaproteobacteria bacterium]
MRKVLMFMSLMALPWVSCASGAAQPQAPAAKAVAMQPDPQDQVICRRIEVTGSLMHKRVCQTKREWDNAAKAGQDAVRGMQQRNMMNQSGSGG